MVGTAAAVGRGVQSIDGEHMYGGPSETDMPATLLSSVLSSVVYASRSHRQASNSSSVRSPMNNSVPHSGSPVAEIRHARSPASLTFTRRRIRWFRSAELTVMHNVSFCGGIVTSESKMGSVVKGVAQQAVVLGMVLKSHGHCACALAP